MADIIWKGKSSKEIDGLIITDIPPITKPKMKTNKIEIIAYKYNNIIIRNNF